MIKLNHGSLFSGIGGFDLAAEWAGWNNVFHCEWNEFGQKILNYYWPNATSYGDIKQTDFTIWRDKIFVLSGGFPCQPYSTAGKRLGKEDSRHLWPEMRRAIREIRPTWVVGENVYGLVNWSGGLVFEELQADLEAEGYEVQPCVIPACGVGAPHKRERVWFIAHSINNRYNTGREKKEEKNGIQEISREEMESGELDRADISPTSTNPISTGGREDSKGELDKSRELLQGQGRQENPNEFVSNEQGEFITNTPGIRLEGFGRSEQELGGKQRSCGSNTYTNKSNFWQNFPTEPPICRRDDGLSDRLDGITFPKWRTESIKAYGNAIVPQVAYEIFKVINKIHEQPS